LQWLVGVSDQPQPGDLDDAFFRLSGDLLAVTDAKLTCLHLNPAWSDQLGYSLASLEGRSLLDVVAPRDRDKVKETLLACLASGVTRTFDAALLRTSQQKRQAQVTASPHAENGRVYVVARDITVRKRLEHELASAQKLEAIGQLVSGIAHEINTPMQFVGDNLVFLGDSFVRVLPMFNLLNQFDFGVLPTPAQWAELGATVTAGELKFLSTEVPLSISSACEGVERVAQLIRSLREFAHADSDVMAPADLNRTIEHALVVSRSQWKYVADTTTEFGELPPVHCHSSAVSQVLLNLICNASHAIAEKRKQQGEGAPKGLIHIATSCDGHIVTIAVRDTGAGIPRAVQPRIFEPFFTTKEVGRGTGQGLSISRTIVVDAHKGRLDFESEVGVGTTFYVRLPLREEPPVLQ
jgi:PAS domain S-box-containing protein